MSTSSYNIITNFQQTRGVGHRRPACSTYCFVHSFKGSSFNRQRHPPRSFFRWAPQHAAPLLRPGTQANWRIRRRRSIVEAMTADWDASYSDGDVRVWTSQQQPDERLVTAELRIYASVDEVWRVVTDYERLAEFIPNLAQCKRLPGAPRGRIHLRQRGCSQGGLWRLEATSTLELVERRLTKGRREVRFKQLEGDFRQFSGCWLVSPSPPPAEGGPSLSTILRYDVAVVPHLSVPSALVAHVVRNGLPANLKAIAAEAEAMARRHAGAPKFAVRALVGSDDIVLLPPTARAVDIAAAEAAKRDECLPPKAIRWPWEQGRLHVAAPSLQRGRPSQYLGTVSVPLPPAASPPAQLAGTQDALHQVYLQTSYPPFELGGLGNSGSPQLAFPGDSVREVHLRRLDQPDKLHRRAVSVITIDAAVNDVWDVLTDYEALAAVVPNLAVSERLPMPPGSPSNLVRLRQVGVKGVAYLMLHGESIMDIVEVHQREIQFRQVSGDFLQLQGKFILAEEAGAPEALHMRSPKTVLKYAVEVVLPHAARVLGLLEPMLERVVFEDVPANLAAIKRHVERSKIMRQIEALEAAGDTKSADLWRRRLERPSLQVLMQSLPALCGELRRCYSDLGRLPARAEMRADGRTDLEKAIRAHGGAALVTAELGWKPVRVRRPNGYWDDVGNVRRELHDFIAAAGLPPGVMPTKAEMMREGRRDLSKASERWGGVKQLAAAVNLPTRGGDVERGSAAWRSHVAQVAAETGLSGVEGLFELAAKSYDASRNHKRAPVTSTIQIEEPSQLRTSLHAQTSGRGSQLTASGATSGQHSVYKHSSRSSCSAQPFATGSTRRRGFVTRDSYQGAASKGAVSSQAAQSAPGHVSAARGSRGSKAFSHPSGRGSGSRRGGSTSSPAHQPEPSEMRSNDSSGYQGQNMTGNAASASGSRPFDRQRRSGGNTESEAQTVSVDRHAGQSRDSVSPQVARSKTGAGEVRRARKEIDDW